MAFSVTSSGVTGTSGRGKAAVSFTLSFREIESWAKKMKADEKELWRLSYGRAVSGLKKKFVSTVAAGGGSNGVPKFRDFEDFTTEYRRVRGVSSPMGGVLAEKRSVVAYKRGKAQVIGWHDALGEVARHFQDGFGGADAEAMFTDARQRRYIHKRGVKDVPRSYVHNPRPVINPYFLQYVKAHLDEWARQAYFKGLAKLMRGGKDRAFSGAFPS